MTFRFNFYGYLKIKHSLKNISRDGWQLLRESIKTYCKKWVLIKLQNCTLEQHRKKIYF